MSSTWTPPTSYMEDRFMSFWERYAPDIPLERQTPIDDLYYPDFLHQASRVIVEIDGAQYHSSPAQFERDQARQAYLEEQGYTVLRFTGKEVYHAPVKCVYIARGAIQRRISSSSKAGRPPKVKATQKKNQDL